jgi:hypothetical protein
MSLALRQIKVYCKLALIGAVIITVGLTVLFNRNNEATVWFFRTHEKVNVLYLILGSAVVSIVAFWIATRIRGVIREFRRVRDEKREAVRRADQERMAKEITDREKRLDEKLRRSLSEDSEPKVNG